ncbi:MAG TPA: CHC2 zinc finger domain-containing protein, partial [Spirochaetota bacterium]|nr:CHC2 zinc finger domain-containing protein [Spirochaetota bacterium]
MRRLKGKTLEVGDFLDGFGKEEVVRSTDIVKLFASFGVKLERKGKSYVGRCPWHEDKTPSLSVDAEKKLYNCFGCGESGDVFTLVEKMKGCSFREALEYLRREEFRYYERKETYPKETVIQQVPQDETERVTVNISPSTNDLEKINAEEVQTTLPEEDNTNGILKEVMDWYSGKLNSNAEAKAYLEQRALFDAELLTGFGIGFADGSLLEVIGEERKAELVSIGILNDKEGRVWEHFGNCVIIPVTDENGLIAGVYGRSIDDESNFKHRYLKGTHKGIFNRKASAVYKEIILTESILDAMSLIKLGFDNTQSIYGTNGFTEEHLKQLKNDRVKTVILALDNDEAGRSASIKLKEKLTGEGFSVKEISPARLPSDPQDRIEAKDWNEYLVRVSAEDGVSSAAVEIRKKIDEAEKSEREEEEKFSLERDGLYYSARSGNVKYRISGVKEMFAGSLRVAVKAETEGGSFVDSLELYSSRARGTFALNFSKAAGLEAKSVENDLIRILEGLEEERDRRILTPETEEKELTEEEKELGLSLLKSPDIFEEIVKDMDLLGYVGEDVNKKLMYLAASSRILDDPISVIILSQSSAGKSYLAETVRKLMPPEETISVTSLSDQALNYMEDLMHKFLILGETVHSDAVEHQIREMLSGKELSRLVTVKDEKTGTMRSAVVKRPVVVSAVMSGTDYGINPENASRCFVISADESREQTRRIHEKQRGKYSLDR